MELKDFKKIFDNKAGIDLNDEYMIYNDLELYSKKTDESITFNSFEELFDYKLGNKTIGQMIEEKDNFNVILDDSSLKFNN